MYLKYNLLYETNKPFHSAIDTLDNGLYSLKKLSVPYYIEPPYSYFKICYKNDGYKEEYLNSDSKLYSKGNNMRKSIQMNIQMNIPKHIRKNIQNNIRRILDIIFEILFERIIERIF